MISSSPGSAPQPDPGESRRVSEGHGASTGDVPLLSRAVRDVARETRFPVAFGGWVSDGAVHVSTVVGARGHTIEGLVVEPQRGLGGQALVERRPRLTLDYRTARSITHDYDGAILGEGIATLFAVPIIAAGRARGVLYCGSWSQSAVDERIARPAMRVAQELATELRVREEVERRLAHVLPPEGAPTVDPAVREELRESYAELRRITATVVDDELRDRLEKVERRLMAISRTDAATASTPASTPQLSPRELDVLACAALGSTNRRIAEQLSLRETTVKSYLASAMSKLDAPTRQAAVIAARRAGLLP